MRGFSAFRGSASGARTAKAVRTLDARVARAYPALMPRSRASRAPVLPSALPDTATGYIRLSKAAGTDNLSAEGMVADVERKAADLGVTLIGPVHVDNGKSGAIRDRPEFVAWLDDVRECRASVMLTWHTDRLTREGINAAALILDAQEGKDPTTGAVVRTPARLVDCAGLDSDDREGFRFRFVIGAEVARAERERMRARNIATQARLIEAGRFRGGKVPYGFTVAPAEDGRGKVLIEAPVEAAIMRDSLEALLSGESAGSIVRRLNASGPARPGKALWTLTSFRDALMSDTARARLWTPGEWRALAAAFDARAEAASTGGRHPAQLLSGLAVCSGCDRTLHAGTRARSTVYRCDRRNGSCPTPGLAVTARLLDDAVTDWFLSGFGRLPYSVTRTRVQGADDLARAEDAEAAALAAFTADPSPANADEYRLARAHRETLAALPAQTETFVLSTGRTYGEEWAAGDVHSRRSMLADVVARIDVFPVGRGGSPGLAPSRYRILTHEELAGGSPDPE